MAEDTKQLTVSLIIKRNVQKKTQITEEDNEKITEDLLKLTHVRLDREKISEIENLECLGNVTNLYLQSNVISKISNLDCLSSSLRFLTLSGNRITKVEGLLNLQALALLDLSDNLIKNIDFDELPQNLVFVSFKGNECCNKENYSDLLLQHLPKLKSIDGEELSDDDFTDDEEEDDNDGVECLEEKSESAPTSVWEASNKVLLRSDSRLHKLEEEHKSRIQEINKKMTLDQIENPSQKSSEEDFNVSEIEEQIRKVLADMVQAEHAVMNSFELPKLGGYKIPELVPSSDDSIPDYEPEQALEENISPKKKNLVSTGTTTSSTSKPKLIKPTNRQTNPSASRFRNFSPKAPLNKSPQPPPNKRQAVRSPAKPKSLIRIPGSRPFSKP
uniref:leucine-rich repeat-containing protein 46 isoform X2 n=1 Tax=Ciona intestinalis TaxID=7719 RepID=UPI00089DAB7A|nr:leucine-rich repeat-containing protein 46 isoform X2 [Ciona intestinalis]|eukprot:XP_018669222.1 leucine-rich repeat-containing protein 46 isoform X2 [Ciona intestinalis]